MLHINSPFRSFWRPANVKEPCTSLDPEVKVGCTTRFWCSRFFLPEVGLWLDSSGIEVNGEACEGLYELLEAKPLPVTGNRKAFREGPVSNLDFRMISRKYDTNSVGVVLTRLS